MLSLCFTYSLFFKIESLYFTYFGHACVACGILILWPRIESVISASYPLDFQGSSYPSILERIFQKTSILKNLLKKSVSKLTLKAREIGESEAWQKIYLATLGSGSEVLGLFSGVKRERNIPYLILYWCVICTEFLQVSEWDKICDTNTFGLSDSYYLGRGNAAVCKRPGLLIILPMVELNIISRIGVTDRYNLAFPSFRFCARGWKPGLYFTLFVPPSTRAARSSCYALLPLLSHVQCASLRP